MLIFIMILNFKTIKIIIISLINISNIQGVRPLPEQSAFDQCGMSPRLPFYNNQINNDDFDSFKIKNYNKNQHNFNNNNNDNNIINSNSKVEKSSVVNNKISEKNINHS